MWLIVGRNRAPTDGNEPENDDALTSDVIGRYVRIRSAYDASGGRVLEIRRRSHQEDDIDRNCTGDPPSPDLYEDGWASHLSSIIPEIG